jgi:hypothetical protein
MNERQAFGWAVRSLRLYDWKSDQPRFQVNGDSLTIRELCEGNGLAGQTQIERNLLGSCNLPA